MFRNLKFREHRLLHDMRILRFLLVRRLLFLEAGEQREKCLEIYMLLILFLWPGFKVHKVLVLHLLDTVILQFWLQKRKYSFLEVQMASNISMICTFWIYKWWPGVNQNVKVLFLLQDKAILLSKLALTWLYRVGSILMNRLRGVLVLGKVLNYNLAI